MHRVRLHLLILILHLLTLVRRRIYEENGIAYFFRNNVINFF
jgi:hypothetical protein